jgi:hypothetical protein
LLFCCATKFALKHEGVHLEALSRLFAAAPAAEIEAWVRGEPTGRYARRTGFLYEWLTGKRLDVPDTTRGNYIPALDPELELTSPTPVNNARWRVRDNLLGNAGFCPQVHLTPDTKQALAFNAQFATVRRLHLASPQMQEAGLRSGLLLIPNERRVYGASSLILVAQFPRDVRVPPQEPIAPVRYCANVQV